MTYSAVKKGRVEFRKGIVIIRYTDSEVNEFIDEINTNFEPEESVSEDQTIYGYNEIKLNKDKSRGDKIAAIIETKYTKDDQIAMLANIGDGDEQHAAEVASFQKFRKFAKKLVDEKI